jgi:hypothetical protein
MFEDTEFPPLSSLSIPLKSNPVAEFLKSQITWQRLQSSETIPIELFGNSLFFQGNSLNPSLFSVLSALNEYPQRVEKLFLTTSLSYQGEYVLTIYHKGSPCKLKLDNIFPYYKNDFAFLTPSKLHTPQAVWPIFVEKLWAKKSGGYFKGNNKHISIVLTDLTGAPCDVLKTESNNLTEKLVKSLNNNFIILASPRHLEGNPRVSFMIKSFKDSRFLIQAPAGCDLPSASPDEGLRSAWQGSSYLSEHFDSFTICKIHDSYKYSFIHSNKPCFQVTLTTLSKTYFQVFHEKPAQLKIVVADDKGYLICKSLFGSRIHVEIDASPGKYFVFVQHSHQITFSVYSVMNAGIEEMEEFGFFKNLVSFESVSRHPDARCVEVIPMLQAWTLERLGSDQDSCRAGFVFYVFRNLNEFSTFVEVKSQVLNLEMNGLSKFLILPGGVHCLYFRQIEIKEPVIFQVSVRAKLING